MKFEKEPTDQQLDELLQDVAVPQDLKALLKQIPLQSEDENSDELGSGGDRLLPVPDSAVPDSTAQQNRRATPIKENTTQSRTWIGLILAASLIGFGMFIASGYLPSHDDTESSIASDNKAPELETNLAVTEIKLKIEDLELQSLEAQIHAIEMAQLEAKLLRMEQASTYPTDQVEVKSIIAAMSEQYSIPLGMPEVKVKSGMARVIQNFPGTQGAAMAQSYLEQTQNN